MLECGRVYKVDAMSDFGDRLKNEIDKVGLNQRKVSLKTGLDYPFINKIIRNNQNITVDTLVKLLRVPELRPFIIDEMTTKAPELFDKDTIRILQKAAQIFDTHTQEELKLIYTEAKKRREEI